MTVLATPRRSTSDMIFERLYDQIMSLDILPGTKLSEAEMASKFGVSRQPVREALNRLGSLNLVVIQPQKASRVRRFSLPEIQVARFSRLAIEIEVSKNALQLWNSSIEKRFRANLAAQSDALAASDAKAFHKLDEDFHHLMTQAAQAPFVFDQIKRYKSHVDSICVLSLKGTSEMADLINDHARILDCLAQGDAAQLEQVLRLHLSRIENTIKTVRNIHPGYFEDQGDFV